MSAIKDVLRKIVPYRLRQDARYHIGLNGNKWGKIQKNKVEEIRKRGYVNILFIACSLSMWRYESVVKEMSKDSRFRFKIIYCPNIRYSRQEAKNNEEELNSYFKKLNIKMYSTLELGQSLDNWFDEAKFDLIFYCQPYPNFHDNCLRYEDNRDKLWGQIDYTMNSINDECGYNTEFHNLAWRLYQPTNLHLNLYKKCAAHRGKNVVVVGEPNAEKYIEGPTLDPWKKISDNFNRRRIVWAPHFSINDYDILHRNSFLWLNEFMIKLALDYKDKVQIAFKPHPHLYSELCKNPKWGVDKTNSYYNFWRDIKNGQLETGQFTDLFMTSDAIIHDCGSFTGEYLFTKKPGMFVSTHIDETYNTLNEFGKLCLDNYYIGESVEDVKKFIDEVVLNGNDIKMRRRVEFHNGNLMPPNNNTVGENIYIDLCKAFNFKLH